MDAKRLLTREGIGFSGTQKGMTLYQRHHLIEELIKLAPTPEIRTFTPTRHGDCIGADEEFHAIALELGFPVVIHPPNVDAKRAFCQGYAAIVEPEWYLDRNAEIVRRSFILLATPGGPPRVRGSGTWHAIRCARAFDVPSHLIWPEGVPLG